MRQIKPWVTIWETHASQTVEYLGLLNSLCLHEYKKKKILVLLKQYLPMVVYDVVECTEW